MENAIQELLRGQEFTCQLKLLLTVDSSQSFLARKGGCAQDLVGKILSTFTHTISLLNTATATIPNVDSSDEASQLSHLAGPRKSSDSSTAETSTKKRKTAATSQESWVKESPTVDDDGYAWRKYGQKTILNSDFSRHYYRCTYKLDHNCPATKQVQMIQARPSPLYRTTYSAHHTCTHFRTLHRPSHQHFLLDPVDDSSNRNNIISFSSSTNSINTPFLTSFSASSSAPPVVRQQQTSSSSNAVSCGHQTAQDRPAACSEGDDDYDVFSSLVDGDFDQELLAAIFHDNCDSSSSASFMRMMMMHSGDDLGGFLL
ncbi:unnamed protein product [Linum tenue]|uniref:WRKY domain-containing protein n=1 Tax=Linum tenue TaxID=586396 RepID=A0AAV0KN58_9ROSI|nr:unnamed protein product [Linum tenue]